MPARRATRFWSLNHLAELFTRLGLRFTPQARTETSNQPDFIFPGAREYHDATLTPALLVMLGVKSTSKDRWRQVLTESAFIRFRRDRGGEGEILCALCALLWQMNLCSSVVKRN